MKKALFLYNPRSGRGHIARRVEAIVEALDAGGYVTEPHRIDFAENPFDSHPDTQLVVVAGGDGTVNFAVNRMKERGLDLPLGIIPAGTANDFAGIVGMSHDPVEAARQIASGSEQRLDCGRVNGLHFVNIFSFGLFTTTSQHTPDRLKHRVGKTAYLLEGWREVFRMHAIPLHITTERETFDVQVVIALIFNGETAGGFRLAETSSVRDGLFDCLMLEKRHPLLLCWAMLRYMLGGKPRCLRHLRAATIRMESPLNEPTDVDGQRGARFPLQIECLPGALRVICPGSGRDVR